MLENGTVSLTGLAARIGAELAGVSPTIRQKGDEISGKLFGEQLLEVYNYIKAHLYPYPVSDSVYKKFS